MRDEAQFNRFRLQYCELFQANDPGTMTPAHWLLNNGWHYHHGARLGAVSLEDALNCLRDEKPPTHWHRVPRDARAFVAWSDQATRSAEPGDVLLCEDRAKIITSSWTLEDIPVERAMPVERYCYSQRIYGLAFSPDSTRLAIAHGDDIELRLVGSFQQRVTTRYGGHHAGVRALAWSPDGTRIASVDGQGAVHVWKVAEAQPTSTIRPWDAWAGPVLVNQLIGARGRSQSILTTVGWSPTSDMIAVGKGDGHVVFIDPVTTEVRGERHITSKAIMSLAWSPRGGYLATGDNDKYVDVWSAPRFDILGYGWGNRCFTDYTTPIVGVAWSPNDQFLASCDTGQQEFAVRVWEQMQDRDSHPIPLSVYEQGKQGITCLAWSPDSIYLAVGCKRGALQVVSAQRREHIRTFHGTGDITAVAWSPSGSYLATSVADQVRIWQWETPCL